MSDGPIITTITIGGGSAPTSVVTVAGRGVPLSPVTLTHRVGGPVIVTQFRGETTFVIVPVPTNGTIGGHRAPSGQLDNDATLFLLGLVVVTLGIAVAVLSAALVYSRARVHPKSTSPQSVAIELTNIAQSSPASEAPSSSRAVGQAVDPPAHLVLSLPEYGPRHDHDGPIDLDAKRQSHGWWAISKF